MASHQAAAAVAIKQEGDCAQRKRAHDDDGEVSVLKKKPTTDMLDNDQEHSSKNDVQLLASTLTNANADYLHCRKDCSIHPFANAELYCEKCCCYVCDVPAADCPEWKEHCRAHHGEEKWKDERARRKATKQDNQNHDSDIDIFNFDDEIEKIGWHQATQLRERAGKSHYEYQDKEAFLAALELYNRQGCKFQTRETGWGEIREWRVLREWELKPVRGHHRKPCSQCGAEFKPYENEEYLVEMHDGPWGADKACVGCMGRNMRAKYGTNKQVILAELQTWREKQKDGNCPLKTYKEEYYLSYPDVVARYPVIGLAFGGVKTETT